MTVIRFTSGSSIKINSINYKKIKGIYYYTSVDPILNYILKAETKIKFHKITYYIIYSKEYPNILYYPNDSTAIVVNPIVIKFDSSKKLYFSF